GQLQRPAAHSRAAHVRPPGGRGAAEPRIDGDAAAAAGTGVAVKIAFWGSSLVSAYWNGAATYYRGLLRALAERGHRVTFFEPDAYQRQQHRDMADPAWASVVVYDPAGDLEALFAQTAEADLVVKASGIGVLDDELIGRLLARRRRRQRVIYWDVDAPATLAALEAG